MRRTVLRTLATPVLALACLLSAGAGMSPAQAVAPAPRATWTLVDYRQDGCFSPNVAQRNWSRWRSRSPRKMSMSRARRNASASTR